MLTGAIVSFAILVLQVVMDARDDIEQRRTNERALQDLRQQVAASEGREGSTSGLVGFETKLHGAEFITSKLENAFLTGAELVGADLTSACLRLAHLNDAVLLGADLTDADLSDASWNSKMVWSAVRRTSARRTSAAKQERAQPAESCG